MINQHSHISRLKNHHSHISRWWISIHHFLIDESTFIIPNFEVVASKSPAAAMPSVQSVQTLSVCVCVCVFCPERWVVECVCSVLSIQALNVCDCVLSRASRRWVCVCILSWASSNECVCVLSGPSRSTCPMSWSRPSTPVPRLSRWTLTPSCRCLCSQYPASQVSSSSAAEPCTNMFNQHAI